MLVTNQLNYANTNTLIWVCSESVCITWGATQKFHNTMCWHGFSLVVGLLVTSMKCVHLTTFGCAQLKVPLRNSLDPQHE